MNHYDIQIECDNCKEPLIQIAFSGKKMEESNKVAVKCKKCGFRTNEKTMYGQLAIGAASDNLVLDYIDEGDLLLIEVSRK